MLLSSPLACRGVPNTSPNTALSFCSDLEDMESQPDRDDILDRCSSDPDSPVFLEVPAAQWQQTSHAASRHTGTMPSAAGVRSRHLPRYRLPSEDDDAFAPDVVLQPRGTKRSRLASDDDVFFQPRARLTGDSTPLYPRARLPSDSDSSSVFYPRHRRFRGRQTTPLLQPPRDSSSIQLDSSQYTADDTPNPAFKTPYSRPPRRRSSEASSTFPNSTRFMSDEYTNHSTRLSDPPRVTRTPFAWISPNLSGVSQQHSIIPMSSESISDVKQRLFRQIFSFSSASGDTSIADNANKTFNPASAPTTSSPKDVDEEPNLAESILSEEMRPDSGFSSLPSFDGKTCFNQYQERFEDRLVDVMVHILDKVEPVLDEPYRGAKRSKTVKSAPPDVSPSPLGLRSPPEISVYTAAPASSSPVDDVFSSLPPSRLRSSAVSAAPSPISASFFDISDVSLDFFDSFPDNPPPSPCSDVFNFPGSRSSHSSDVLSSTSASSLLPPHDVFNDIPHQPTSLTTPSSSPVFSQQVNPSTKKSKECKICHKILASSSNLRIHMRIHTGERPYLCVYCFRDFRDRTTFRRHERLHTGKPFGCATCGKAFVTRSELRHHINRHHSS